MGRIMEKPDYHSFEEFQNRSQKLAEIREMGIDPYPHRYHQADFAGAIHTRYENEPVGHSEDGEQGTTPFVQLAGRLVLFRGMGKNAFAQLQDETGRIQLMFNKTHSLVEGLDPTTMEPLKFIEKKIDLGDIIGIEGHLFRTGKGELTIYVKKMVLLCKSLLPLPDKHAGLADKGIKYRKRHLDLITDPEVAKTFRMRSEIIRHLRRFLEARDFLEVETPILQNLYGGAEARPFTTHLNALDQDMYLRISPEIALKRLLVGGMGRIFEIAKDFRNEGIDKTHNPEFTMIELYAPYMDYNDMMELTENLFAEIATHLFGTTNLGIRMDKSGNPHEVDLKTPWKRMSMKEAVRVYGKIDVDALSDEELRKKVKETTEEDPKGLSRGLLIAALFETHGEPHLIQPHHIIDHPIETTPLCKLHRDPQLRKERLVERFETFILGFEFCNSYSELNDPQLQRELLEGQAAARDGGDEEASPMDEEFIEAICQGMPPTGGLGIGIDRMVMLLTGATSIRDVLFFPLMRPEN